MVHDIRKPKPGRGRPLTVVWRRIEALRRDSASPRSHSPEQVRRLALSIGAFGFNVPILVDPTLRIIAGHGRLLAAEELGLREVPTILLDHLSPAKARTFMIADNRLAEGAAWNAGVLREQLSELSLGEPDLAIAATGFEPEGIEEQLAAGPRAGRKQGRHPGRAAPRLKLKLPAAPVYVAEAEATATPPPPTPAGARG